MRKSLDQAERAREDAAADAKQAAAKHARALDDLKSQLAAAARERDAARERTRRPSIMPGAVMNESSFNSWTAKRMEAAPHSFG